MNIKEFDKNFDTTFNAPEDIEWFSVNEAPFSLHGVFYAEEEGLYRRMPREIADAVNPGISHLSKTQLVAEYVFKQTPHISPCVWKNPLYNLFHT